MAGRVAGKLFVADADGKSRHRGATAIKGHKIMRIFADADRFRDDPLQAAQEIVAVAISLEAEQVILEQRAQHGLAPGQFLKHVWRGKWNVQEKADARGR